MTNRRNFLGQLALSLPVLRWSRPLATKPIVIATWDSGVPVSEEAWKVIQSGQAAIDAVEAGAVLIENTLNCCVGLGGNPDRDGIVTLDACIMDHQMNCGGVAALERIKNPISVARKVMDDTPHVLLVGSGAQQFALEKGFPLENGELSESAKKTYTEWLKTSEYKPIKNIETQQREAFDKKAETPKRLPNGEINHDTMGLVAIDQNGNLSGACTTSGMGFKMRGRVGDSPIIGAGLYVDNEVGAATSSGQGEEVIRIGGTHLVVEFMRQGKSPKEACKLAVERLVKINPSKAKEFQVGFIALNKSGEHGSYAINPGFMYAVKDSKNEARIIKTESWFN